MVSAPFHRPYPNKETGKGALVSGRRFLEPVQNLPMTAFWIFFVEMQIVSSVRLQTCPANRSPFLQKKLSKIS